jgi:hypothetical protein
MTIFLMATLAAHRLAIWLLGEFRDCVVLAGAAYDPTAMHTQL